MANARTRITAQGQVSVPSQVRRKLGIGPGSVLEWKEEEGRIVVERVAGFSSEDIHRALFRSRRPERKSLEQLKEGVRDRVRKRYARD